MRQGCLYSGTFLLHRRWEVGQRKQPLRSELKATFDVAAKLFGREAQHEIIFCSVLHGSENSKIQA